ncbi:disks large-associated protein 3 isoform X1 [Mauremys reevesii]|uniref:disks large-associated protein 3 isoform X1 n=1 Tax=Mauremys reevesii TaxID=260615 RepID=UPI00193F6DA0|nr:disks large-associated protein 3 isoform X1 [Mauremys reevesii]XP_039367668.1 disks large-associated protein 3 isoform X1 [Mauremys reevesii]XP_039367669.1 disks large-associated protein 3 isoform X1 [Mauremys reevesii]XP_039367670.1 disks large-associated protein 3 isoform X1 [Mauremys reevesii]
MKGYHGERSQSQSSTGHPCHCIPEDSDQPLDYIRHGQESRQPYLLSPSEPCSLDHRYCPSRSPGIPAECPGGPMSLTEPLSASSSSTFPRMHHMQQQYDSCDECMAATHPSSKINRLPPTLLDQFEKQLPLHHDGFHTLQYQRASTTEQRSESPSRIRHLVHSVQKLFAKSHSLEAPAKREYNGTKMEGRGDGYHHHHQHHQSRHGKRSKSKDRKLDSRHRPKMMGWWSSDDNLDSDSSYLVSGRHAVDQGTQYCVDAPESAFRDLTLKSLKSGGEGKCLACAGMSMSLDGQTLKRSAWHTMTVSQAREAYPSSGGSQEKALVLQEAKAKDRGYHYLQVPQDEWSSYPAVGKDGEIPCRRMRSGSYIKAMGDDDSGDSEASAKVSPKGLFRRDGYRRSSSVDQARTKFASRHYSDSYICNCPSCCTPPRMHPRGQGYGRSFTTGQINEELNHQFEAVCESVFGEVESQAVEALDLPGCFRMRSHSYLRAIQAGCSQDDDCLSLFSMAVPPRPAITSSILKPSTSFSYRKAPPPLPPGIKAKPLISVTAQSSTESTHESYLPSEVSRSPSWSKDAAARCNSTESLENSKVTAISLDLPPVQPRGSPKPSTLIIKAIPGREELRSLARQRKWRPSIGVQVETISDSDTESRSQREFHSIGVQVEEDKRRARFKRSNSVTAGVQADLELEGFTGLSVATEDKALQFGRPFHRHSSEPDASSRQYSVFKTVHTQGQWAYREDYQMQYDTVEVPRRDSWIDRGSRSLPDSGRASPCHRDGEWFIKLLQAEVEKMEGWCQQMEREAEDYDLPEEILEKIRSAVGSTQLLMSQKVQQFFRLCQQNMDPNAFPMPTFQDLAGFWDLLQLSIEDVSLKFAELQQLKANGWKLIEPKEEKKVPPPIPKKPPRSKVHPVKERSLDSVDRQRQEARKRLLAAKRAASFRQNSATESADSIEIYIPEAQTRL